MTIKSDMCIGITFKNDTYFSLSNKSEGICVTGHISPEEFKKFIDVHYFDILEARAKQQKGE